MNTDTREDIRDNSSPYNHHVRNELLTREYQIALESKAALREKLAHCVRTETVNQFTHCKELREEYFALCQDKYRGMIFPPGQEPKSRTVPGLIAPKK